MDRVSSLLPPARSMAVPVFPLPAKGILLPTDSPLTLAEDTVTFAGKSKKPKKPSRKPNRGPTAKATTNPASATTAFTPSTPPTPFVQLTPELSAVANGLLTDPRYGHGASISLAQTATEFDISLPQARQVFCRLMEQGQILPQYAERNPYTQPWLILDPKRLGSDTVTQKVFRDALTAYKAPNSKFPPITHALEVVDQILPFMLPGEVTHIQLPKAAYYRNHAMLTSQWNPSQIEAALTQHQSVKPKTGALGRSLFDEFYNPTPTDQTDPLASLTNPRDVHHSGDVKLIETPRPLDPLARRNAAAGAQQFQRYLHRILTHAEPGKTILSDPIIDSNPIVNGVSGLSTLLGHGNMDERSKEWVKRFIHLQYNFPGSTEEKIRKIAKQQGKTNITPIHMHSGKALDLFDQMMLYMSLHGYIDHQYNFTHKVQDYQRTDDLVRRFNKTADKTLTFYLVPPKPHTDRWTLGYCWTLPKEGSETEAPRLGIPSKHYALPSMAFDESAFTGATERALDEASRAFPALRNQYFPGIPPKPMGLNTDEVIAFLDQAAPRLKRAGFNVLLPKRIAQPTPPLPPTDPEMAAPSHDSLSTLPDVDETTADPTLREILGIRTTWVDSDVSTIRTARQTLRQPVNQATTGAAPATNPLDDNLVTTLETLLTKIQSGPAFTLQTPPAGFNATLLNFQQVGYSWLKYNADRSVGSILGDTMGLGKTIQTLALLQDRYNRRPSAESGQRKPTLIVAPTEVIPGWMQEIAGRPGNATLGLRDIPAKTTIPANEILDLPSYLRRHPRVTDAQLRQVIESATVVLTTYQTMRSRVDVLTGDEDNPLLYDGVILDEAHHIADPETQQSQAAYKLGQQADYRIALTGTPLQNRLLDIASLVHFVEPGRLGSFKRFVTDYEDPIVSNAGNAPQVLRRLAQKLSPILLRRSNQLPPIMAELQGHMPNRVEHNFDLPLDEEQARYYIAALAAENPDRTLIEQLRKICNHPNMADPVVPLMPGSARAAVKTPYDNAPTSRMKHLNTIINTRVIPNGEQIVIFTHFVEMANRLGAFLSLPYTTGLPKKPALVITGETEQHQRRAHLNAFRNDPKNNPVLIMTYGTGGEGLNLQNARHVALYDPEWNPFREEQAISRVQRIMDRQAMNIAPDAPLPTVQVYRYSSHLVDPETKQPLPTIEGKMQQVKQAKSQLATTVVGSQSPDATLIAQLNQADLVRQEIAELRARRNAAT